MTLQPNDWLEFDDVYHRRFSLRARTVRSVVDVADYFDGQTTLEEVCVLHWDSYPLQHAVIARDVGEWVRAQLSTDSGGGVRERSDPASWVE